MIIKGSSRGGSEADVVKLARHLLARENETVAILEGCDGPGDLQRRLSEFRAVTLGTRSRRALYHASLSLAANEAFELDDQRWRESVDCLERHLGLQGHQRVVIGHSKGGRRHCHVVWCRCRVHGEALVIAADNWSYRKHEAAARELESRWATRPVAGFHSPRIPGAPPPKPARASHDDWQAQTRTGIQVDDVAAVLQKAWESTKTGRAFKKAIEADGLLLANGRRGIIVVDQMNAVPHSLSRRLQLRAADVQRRLRDVEVANLPTVEAVQKAMKSKNKTDNRKGNMMPKSSFGCKSGQRKKFYSPLDFAHRDYWVGLGHPVEKSPDGWVVKLSKTTILVDAGDRLTLHRVGDPTDAEIMEMIRCGAARNWKGIHFFGGTEAFQRRAKQLALESGLFSADQISAEIDQRDEPRAEAKPAPTSPMPEHIRKRLSPDEPPPEPPAAPMTDIPEPTQELRP